MKVFNALKGWYQEASENSSNPYFHTLECQMSECEELYGKVNPWVDPIPIHVDPFPVNDANHESLDVLVELFERVVLLTNTKKTKMMTCVPGKIRVCLSNRSYYFWQIALLSAQELAKWHVECAQCGLLITAVSLPSHLESHHRI